MTLTEATALTPEQRRVKLAELVGLRDVQVGPWYGYDIYGNAVSIPRYDTSLDAIAAVERSLTSDQRWEYIDNLCLICRDNSSGARR